MPGNRRYYDVEVGLVHLYAVDSYENEPDGATAASAQAKWLRDALAAPRTACLRVVYFHHTPYSSGDFAVPRMRWPFAAWGADVVIAGHDHTYERLSVDGIPYFVNGLGGSNRFGFSTTAPESQFKYVDEWGAMLVTVTRAGVTYEFYDFEGARVDTAMFPVACP